MNNHTHSHIGAANNYAMASLILSIAAFVGLGPLGSISGIICGISAIKKFSSAGVIEGHGMARAGIVIGWIGLALFVASITLMLIWMHQVTRVH